MIRGRSDKNNHSALAQYASHELPSVMKQNNTKVPGVSNVGREVSERSRRRLSNGANS